MRVRHGRFLAQILLWVIPVLLVSGCAAPGYNEREAMLFEDKLTIEPKFGTFMATNSNFTGGTVSGMRIDYEYDYNAHLGIEVSATRDVDIDNDSLVAGAPGSLPSNQAAFRDLAELALSSSDRRTLVFTIDWDVPLAQDGSLPYLRYGLGLGALLTHNNLDPVVVASYLANAGSTETIAVTNQAMVLFRPSASLRWDLLDETLTLFAEAQVDVASHHLVFDFDSDGDRSPVVDFGGVSLLFGASFSF